MDESEVMTVLPKELRLGAPPTMPQARSYLYRQQSTLSAYNPDQQIQINIPRLQRSYLRKDSFLQFRLNGQYLPATLTTTGGVKQYSPDLFLDDAGAWSLFERLEVFDYLGSTVLESIDGVPQLMSLLIDMGADFTDPDKEGEISHGLNSQYVATNYSTANSGYRIVGSGDPIGFPVQVTGTNDNKFIIALPNTDTPATYTLPNFASSSDKDAWLDHIQAFINTQTPALDGLKVFYNAAGKIDFFHPSKRFSLSAPATGSCTNKFGYGTQLTAGGAAITATGETESVSGTVGVGKNSYTGGMPLVHNQLTTEETLRDFSYQFSIPLPSFLGFLSKKMVPLHNGFSIVLTLASQYKPMFIAVKQVPTVTFLKEDPLDASNTDQKLVPWGNNTAEPSVGSGNVNSPGSFPLPTTFWWQVSDVSLVCQILELGPAAESMLLSTSQGQPLILHTKQLRHYQGSMGATAAEFSLPLNLNVASLTNVLWFMRPTGTENSLSYASIGNRARNMLQRWEMQYGSTVLPQSNGIQAMYMADPDTPGISGGLTTDFKQWGFTECFNELLKSRPNNPHRGRFSRSNYSNQSYCGKGNFVSFGVTPFRCSNSTNGEPRGDYSKFACGLGLELAAKKSGDLICGLNTNGMNTLIRGYFHPSFIVNNDKFDSVVDLYAEYDAFINISPGIATTVSF